jgi:GNAT superfamily N-acetyltransferase
VVVTMREAVRTDVERIVAWQVAMAAETEGLSLDVATVHCGVTALFDDPRRGAYVVAEVHGQPAGCLMVLPEWSDWRNGTVLWIHSVYVDPAFRRRGVFNAMYRHLRERVETDPSLMGLRLFVDRRNENAQRTYRALGMSDEHYRLFEWFKP